MGFRGSPRWGAVFYPFLMRLAVRSRAEPDPAAIRLTIESFLAECKRPALAAPGEQPRRFEQDSYRLSVGPRGALLEIWGPGINLTRRITEARSGRGGRLELRAARFGGRDETLYLQDASAKRVNAPTGGEHGPRWFERLVQREFPGASIESLTRSRDLEHSLSGLHFRGRLREGAVDWALAGAAPDASQQHCDDALVTGLIWLSELRKRKTRHVAGLRVLLPQGKSATSAERMARLEPSRGAYSLFEYHPRGGLTAVDLADRGNLDVYLPHLMRPQDPPERVQAWLRELNGLGVETVTMPDGRKSLRVNGLEFAKAGSSGLCYGLHEQRVAGRDDFGEVLRLARMLIDFRGTMAANSAGPLYAAAPESWLESRVRRRIQDLDPALESGPIYSQTPAIAGLERGLIDLLAIGRDGRLAVIELKASESLRLPLQALDYWIRVETCRKEGRLTKRGYFSGHGIADAPARVLLAAPALHFHPATESLLSFLPSEAEVERIGLASTWRRRLSVVFRKHGADPTRLAARGRDVAWDH